eukprot:4013001-Prorocentrum_lima.AAC.1
MTSSLVGSEMCIRDSHHLVHGRRRCHAKGVADVRTPSTHTPKLHVAVSYTHLTLPTICSV